MVEIISEFLEFYKMSYSLSIFNAESNFKEKSMSEKLMKKYNLNDKNKPVLLQILEKFLKGEKGIINKKTDEKTKIDSFY